MSIYQADFKQNYIQLKIFKNERIKLYKFYIFWEIVELYDLKQAIQYKIMVVNGFISKSKTYKLMKL